MNQNHFDTISRFESDLWAAADNLRDGKPLEAAFDLIEDKLGARRNRTWKSWTLREDLTQYEDARQRAHNEFHQFDYFRHQLHWLFSRFPAAKFMPVPGLCKAVTRAEIAEADWSLTPGRYVGVAPVEVDEDFDFGQTLRDIHTELADLNKDAVALAAKIQANFEGLGI